MSAGFKYPEQDILPYLEEAADENTSEERLREIERHFLGATSGSWLCFLDFILPSKRAGVRKVLKQLYWVTIGLDRKRLPSLAPAFEIMCGSDRRGDIVAHYLHHEYLTGV